MRVQGGWRGSQPGACLGGPAGLEMQTTMSGEGGVTKNAGHGLGLNLTREGLLGRGVTLSVNVGPGGDDSPQRVLGSRQVTTIIKVERILATAESNGPGKGRNSRGDQ